jgi:sulfite exporter TauE/SafE
MSQSGRTIVLAAGSPGPNRGPGLADEKTVWSRETQSLASDTETPGPDGHKAAMGSLVLSAALAGLIGSVHCMGMCGGFAVACGGRISDTALWHAGRITTYAVLGALAGALGGVIPGPGWVAGVISFALILWFALALAGIVPEPTAHIPGLQKLATAAARGGGAGARFTFGVANGLLPCGLVYATLAIPVASGSAAWGAAAMAAFGLGTTPALSALALGARKITARSIWARRAMALGVLLAGLWSIGMRTGLTGAGPMQHGDMEPGSMQHEPPQAP